MKIRRLLIANRGAREARGSANIRAQRMFCDHQIAQHAQRAGR